jgi:hypothetical protein
MAYQQCMYAKGSQLPNYHRCQYGVIGAPVPPRHRRGIQPAPAPR